MCYGHLLKDGAAQGSLLSAEATCVEEQEQLLTELPRPWRHGAAAGGTLPGSPQPLPADLSLGDGSPGPFGKEVAVLRYVWCFLSF